jgi:CRP/FNR family transcriptional regulator, cyclic AMP receptor protein
MMTPNQIDLVCKLLRSSAAFEGMPKDIAQRVAALMDMHVFDEGRFLTQEGSVNSGQLMIVASGEAEISSNSKSDGAHLVHRVAKAGHIIGEVGFIDGNPHSATCKATSQMHVAVLSRDDFVAMFEADPMSAAQLMAGLLKLLAKRIRHANAHMLAQDEMLLQLQTEMLSLQKAKPLR